METPRCVFLGTPEFALPSIEAIAASNACALVGVITRPDEPAGRGAAHTPPPVASWTRARAVPLVQPKTTAELNAALRGLQPDVAIVVAYGRIIPRETLSLPRHGFVNLHPSLLPRWRGPSPIAAAIDAGDRETGVTVMLLDEAMDHGPILTQERIAIPPGTGRIALERDLAARGADLLLRTLPDHLAGRIVPQPQDDALATVCPLRSRAGGRLDWSQPAEVLERRVRAFEGWPGTWCELPGGRRLKVLAAALDGPTDRTTGSVIPHAQGPAVACGDHRLLGLTRVQLEGGTPMDGAAFLHGHPDLTSVG